MDQLLTALKKFEPIVSVSMAERTWASVRAKGQRIYDYLEYRRKDVDPTLPPIHDLDPKVVWGMIAAEVKMRRRFGSEVVLQLSIATAMDYLAAYVMHYRYRGIADHCLDRTALKRSRPHEGLCRYAWRQWWKDGCPGAEDGGTEEAIEASAARLQGKPVRSLQEAMVFEDEEAHQWVPLRYGSECTFEKFVDVIRTLREAGWELNIEVRIGDRKKGG